MDRAVGNGKDFLLEFPWNETFAKGGQRVKEGDKITRPKYAKTLNTIAQYGVQEFYEGEIAKSIARAVQNNSGILTENDLRSYSIDTRDDALIDSYHNHTIASPMAPSSGVIAQKILKVLDRYDDLFHDQNNVHRDTHRMIEAMRFGYAMVRGIRRNGFSLDGR